VNEDHSLAIAEKFPRDGERSFVFLDGDEAGLFVHSVKHPRRRHARACAEFKQIARRLCRRKRAEQTAGQ
jgi:hypothetical protein